MHLLVCKYSLKIQAIKKTEQYIRELVALYLQQLHFS